MLPLNLTWQELTCERCCMFGGRVQYISSLRGADSIHIIYIDLELIYLYFENIFGCNGVGSESSEECHFLR